MRILVTGGTGLIGRHCIDGLVKSGHNVHGVYSSGEPPKGTAQWERANLLDAADREALIDSIKPDTLIHLAWDCANFDGPEQQDWVDASMELIRQFQLNGGQSLFTAGTSMEYAWDGQVCHEGLGRFNSSTKYGHAKHALWKEASEFCSLHKLNYCHGRIFFICGLGQERTKLVPAIIHSQLKEESFVCRSAHFYRDYLDVREVSKIINALVENHHSGDFNIASGVATKIEDIVRRITSEFENVGLVEFVPPPESPPSDLTVVADVNKISSALGYTPKFDLEKTILETIHWMKEI